MTLFTRRHYQAIAEEFKGCRESAGFDHVEVEAVVAAFVDMFLRDNPNFNREKFLKACGMEGE